MQKTFRTRSQAAPEFHHFDIPRHIVSNPGFDISNLMQKQNFFTYKNGSVHCRITYCQKFRNFKIVRPDRIPNSRWHEIKQEAGRLVQDYCAWYSTPPPRTAPAEIHNLFLFKFQALEDGETTEFWTREEGENLKKWQSVNAIGNATRMLEAYFDEFPVMRWHPMVYTFISGQMIPSLDDVPLIVHFREIFTQKSVNMLYDAVLKTSNAVEFCQELTRCKIYPTLSDVEGHLTFEIPFLTNTYRNQAADMLFHDLNIDLLVLGALMKEANFLQRRHPGPDHMMQVLPNTIYHLFNMRDRMEYLCKTELWRTYHFTRVACCGANQVQHQEIPRRSVLSFAICNSCTVYCACEHVYFNWTAEFSAASNVRRPQPKRAPDTSPVRTQKRARIPFTEAPPAETLANTAEKEIVNSPRYDQEDDDNFLNLI